jgi:hypothetical protein
MKEKKQTFLLLVAIVTLILILAPTAGAKKGAKNNQVGVTSDEKFKIFIKAQKEDSHKKLLRSPEQIKEVLRKEAKEATKKQAVNKDKVFKIIQAE